MEIALVFVAVFSFLVAIVAVVWAVRRPVPSVEPMETGSVIDPAVLAQMIGSEEEAGRHCGQASDLPRGEQGNG